MRGVDNGAVERLAYGYELMHRAICNLAGTSGADGRWYYERANEVLNRVSPVFDITPTSNPPKPGDCLTGYRSYIAAMPAPSDQEKLVEQIELGLSAIDVENAACPANTQHLGEKPCPKCKAMSNESCRREGTATYRFVHDMRALITRARQPGAAS